MRSCSQQLVVNDQSIVESLASVRSPYCHVREGCVYELREVACYIRLLPTPDPFLPEMEALSLLYWQHTVPWFFPPRLLLSPQHNPGNQQPYVRGVIESENGCLYVS